ncbi:hypothetical protein Tsubulata_019714 [Turnera subulata]|uniref:aminodeoxychorismate synthase n=1 Tax=Turnera subulata TaxID=218843 RepID=A0A9Q0GAX5_9ROSI|nr:hypothetical protein Tsubulata_019714 [Turnera subulata]
MSSGLSCSTSLDLVNAFHGRIPLFGKPSCGVGYFAKNQSLQESHRNGGGKLVVSSHLMPGHIEGSFMGKRRLEEPGRKLEFVRTLLIDNYDSYTYNIYQELSVVNGVPPVVVRNDEWTWEDLCYYVFEKRAFDNIVISPGPGSPTCPADIGICLRLLLECRDIPILGVCLGHQALGYVHGAQIVHASEPVHGRLSEIEHNGCGLFHNIPSGNNSGFKVVRYHSLIIDSESLPKELIPIAWTSSGTLSFLEMQNSGLIPDACECQIRPNISFHNLSTGLYNGTSWTSSNSEKTLRREVIMGIRHSTRPHYGLQFHPESIATYHGRQIFQNFRELTRDYWQRSWSSNINGRSVHYAVYNFLSSKPLLVCMQVPDSSQMFRLPKGEPLGCTNGSSKEVSRRSEMKVTADKNCISMSGLLDFPKSARAMKHLKLRWRKFDKLAEQVGARDIFVELFGTGNAKNTFWLDSSSVEKVFILYLAHNYQDTNLPNLSFYCLEDYWMLLGLIALQLGEKARQIIDPAMITGGYLSIQDAQGSASSLFLETGFLDFLNKELLSFHYDDKDFEGLPFDFHGGYIGYIGYGLKAECGMLSNRHKSNAPDACFFFADNFVVIDHEQGDAYLMSVHEKGRSNTSWLDDTEEKLLSLEASAKRKLERQISQNAPSPLKKAGFVAEKSRQQYINDVRKCLEFIKDGESYELCLTTQMRKRVGEIDSLGLYLHLREKNPAPYAAWLNFANENLCICSSSPERFLRLDRRGVLEAKPIKGTIARGATEEEDEKLKLQLKYSEKDQAENLMIVDLLRNDLGRVCEPGSVHVPNLMDVESYATVHTMVSTIQGKKRSNVTAVECVKAAFPGGSMTGAPKLRSMELLDSIESCSRGIYSGSIGFFSYNQTFDLNIVIRTVVIHEGEASIGAGGAIVALSNPEDEYDEMLLKTRAPAKAVIEFQ